MIHESIEDVLWIKFSNLINVQSDNDIIILFVAYLPPSESLRNYVPETFYCYLLKQVYAYQNIGRLLSMETRTRESGRIVITLKALTRFDQVTFWILPPMLAAIF